MRYSRLPNTDIKVSKICLGTMTFGKQNSIDDGFNQMDYALENGVNFFDTAELYPVPASRETQGNTEKIIGSWFEKRKNRNKIILATKIAGPGPYPAHIRDDLSFSKGSLTDAIEKSLLRLKTDYIDLYQLHWPERKTNTFGKRGYVHDKEEIWKENFEEVLYNLNSFVKDGKIRYIGVSNENPWGIMKFISASKKNLPKMITIQNPYSLLNRIFEIGNSEICMRENLGLLAYSPLGFGLLTGKYRKNNLPNGSRLKLFPNLARYSNNKCFEATELYFELSKKHNLSLTKLSLAFVNDRPFVTSNIIGATNLTQLKENIDSINIKLSSELINEINEIQKLIPNPAP